MNDNLVLLLETIGRKEKKDVRCKGRMPDTLRPCEKILYQTDGEFLYIGDVILNKERRKQSLHCPDCGTKASWTQNPKFNNKGENSGNKFDRKKPTVQKNY